MLQTGAQRARRAGINHVAGLRRMVANQYPACDDIDRDELEVIVRIAVENKARRSVGLELGAHLQPGIRLQGGRANVGQAHRISLTGCGTASVDTLANRPVADRGRAKDGACAAGELRDRLVSDRRRQHLQRKIVEFAPGLIGAKAIGAVVEAVGHAFDHASRVGVGERHGIVGHQRDSRAVDREQQVVGRADLQTGLDRHLGVDDPAARIAVSHDKLARRDIETGELEVHLILVVEDQVGIGLPSRGRLIHRDSRLELKVGRQLLRLEHRHGIAVIRSRGDGQGSARDTESAAVGGEPLQLAVVEVGRAQHVARPARNIAGLDV